MTPELEKAAREAVKAMRDEEWVSEPARAEGNLSAAADRLEAALSAPASAPDAGVVEALERLICEITAWGRGRIWPADPDMGGKRLLLPSARRVDAALVAGRAALAAHEQRQERRCENCAHSPANPAPVVRFCSGAEDGIDCADWTPRAEGE